MGVPEDQFQHRRRVNEEKGNFDQQNQLNLMLIRIKCNKLIKKDRMVS